MASKVRVYGKAQNRTALGIVNAYLVMYPHATAEDLNKAFPLELQSHGTWKSLFRTPEEYAANEANQGLWFAEALKAVIVLSTSTAMFHLYQPRKVCLNGCWHSSLYWVWQ